MLQAHKDQSCQVCLLMYIHAKRGKLLILCPRTLLVALCYAGVQLGLFKALIDIAPSKESAVTSEELADHLKYKPRYLHTELSLGQSN